MSIDSHEIRRGDLVEPLPHVGRRDEWGAARTLRTRSFSSHRPHGHVCRGWRLQASGARITLRARAGLARRRAHRGRGRGAPRASPSARATSCPRSGAHRARARDEPRAAVRCALQGPRRGLSQSVDKGREGGGRTGSGKGREKGRAESRHDLVERHGVLIVGRGGRGRGGKAGAPVIERRRFAPAP